MGLFGPRRRRVESLLLDSDYDCTYQMYLAGGSIGGVYGERQCAIAGVRRGQTLDLVREPHNRHDPNAVAVTLAVSSWVRARFLLQ